MNNEITEVTGTVSTKIKEDPPPATGKIFINNKVNKPVITIIEILKKSFILNNSLKLFSFPFPFECQLKTLHHF